MISFRQLSMAVGSFLCFSVGIGAQTSILTIPGAQPGDAFGAAVAAVGDTDGDGVGDLAVSSTTGGTYGHGYVCILSGVDGSVRLTIDAFNLFGASNLRFGASVAKAGDIDGDGFADLLIGTNPGVWTSSGQPTPSYVESYSGFDGSRIRLVRMESMCASINNRVGELFESLGDVNGDGVPDILTGKQGGVGSTCPTIAGCLPQCSGNVRITSGANPAILFDLLGQSYEGFPMSLANIGDADGDGRDDFITASRGSPHVVDGCEPGCSDLRARPMRIRTHSSATGMVLHEITGVWANGLRLRAVGDLTGDGISETLIATTGAVSLIALVPGLGSIPIHYEPGYFDTATGVGDQDGDGAPDILISRFNRVELRSGVDLAAITSITGPPSFGRSICSLGDINADGLGDFAVGAPSANYVEIFLGGSGTPASAVSVGGGSGDGAMPPPVLAVTPPVLGTSLTFSVSQAVPSSNGTLIASPGPAVMPLPGSPWVVDWNTSVFALAPIDTDPLGDWTLSLPLPTLFAAEGAQFTVQAVVWAPTIGTASNGFELTLGF